MNLRIVLETRDGLNYYRKVKIQSINPATEELLAEFELLSFDVALAAARASRSAQKAWAARPIGERCALIKKAGAVLRAHADEYARLMTLEMGKPLTQSKGEVEKCAWVCDYYAENAANFLKEEPVATEAKKSYVRFDPLGVVLAIMPWNFPFYQVFRCGIPALAAGNGMVLKHASNVPQCALMIEKVFSEAGFPDGLFKTLLVDSKTSTQLIESDGVDAVSLTGSTQAGSQVAAVAGKNLKKCVLELGGSDPFIICADAQIDLVCTTALQARTINNGQSCIAAKRFIIEKPVAEDFTKRLVEQFKTLKMGDPLDASVNIGPLAKKDICDSLELQLQDAVKKGATVLCGNGVAGARAAGSKAGRAKGYFFEPTLITNVTPEMAVYKEETFGPLMVLIAAASLDEAVKMANESEFGLGAALWTQDLERAEKYAAQIESGCVTINGMVKSDPRLPFGGVKKSGFGRELGVYGIKEFVNIKTVVIN